MPKRVLSSGDTAGRSGPAVVDALLAITSDPVVTGGSVLTGSPRLA
ncbi:MAG TPA: hypothetical protein VF965_01570 [Candidatus Limnocylindria bacterium]